jgi:hypothetical protein
MVISIPALDISLIRYMFPPELDSEVLNFRRRESLDPRSTGSDHNDGAHGTRSHTHY